MNRRFDSLQKENERILLSKLADLCDLADKRAQPCFSAFLNEHEQALATQYLLPHSLNPCFFEGGFVAAQRRVLCVLPKGSYSGISLGENDYPFKALTILFPRGYTVSHRDVLGSLMALGIKREAVGDILVGDCLAVVFLLDAVAALAAAELLKIGSVGVGCKIGRPESLPAAFKTEELNGVVSSPRLDAVVAMITGGSRADSARLITQGLVQKNAQLQESISKEVDIGDKLSIRGYGKYIIEAIGNPTKKGKLRINYLKFI